MSNVPLCAKCNKPLSGKVKIVDGKRFHDPACLGAQMTATEVYAPVQSDESEAHEPARPSAPAPEMRHVAFFTWQGQDGTVFNQTVRGADFADFQHEWNAAFEWIIGQGGQLVNTGRASAPTAGAPVAAQSHSTVPSLPQSVTDQTSTFEVDGVKYSVGKVQSVAVKLTNKNELYLNVVVPPWIKFGVPAYKEVATAHFGDLQQLTGKDIPIPAEKQYVVFSLKEDGKPNKVVDFRATKGG